MIITYIVKPKCMAIIFKGLLYIYMVFLNDVLYFFWGWHPKGIKAPQLQRPENRWCENSYIHILYILHVTPQRARNKKVSSTLKIKTPFFFANQMEFKHSRPVAECHGQSSLAARSDMRPGPAQGALVSWFCNSSES